MNTLSDASQADTNICSVSPAKSQNGEGKKAWATIGIMSWKEQLEDDSSEIEGQCVDNIPEASCLGFKHATAEDEAEGKSVAVATPLSPQGGDMKENEKKGEEVQINATLVEPTSAATYSPDKIVNTHEMTSSSEIEIPSSCDLAVSDITSTHETIGTSEVANSSPSVPSTRDNDIGKLLADGKIHATSSPASFELEAIPERIIEKCTFISMWILIIASTSTKPSLFFQYLYL